MPEFAPGEGSRPDPPITLQYQNQDPPNVLSGPSPAQPGNGYPDNFPPGSSIKYNP